MRPAFGTYLYSRFGKAEDGEFYSINLGVDMYAGDVTVHVVHVDIIVFDVFAYEQVFARLIMAIEEELAL